jgi:hypothetical protein
LSRLFAPIFAWHFARQLDSTRSLGISGLLVSRRYCIAPGLTFIIAMIGDGTLRMRPPHLVLGL